MKIFDHFKIILSIALFMLPVLPLKASFNSNSSKEVLEKIVLFGESVCSASGAVVYKGVDSLKRLVLGNETNKKTLPVHLQWNHQWMSDVMQMRLPNNKLVTVQYPCAEGKPKTVSLLALVHPFTTFLTGAVITDIAVTFFMRSPRSLVMLMGLGLFPIGAVGMFAGIKEFLPHQYGLNAPTFKQAGGEQKGNFFASMKSLVQKITKSDEDKSTIHVPAYVSIKDGSVGYLAFGEALSVSNDTAPGLSESMVKSIAGGVTLLAVVSSLLSECY